MKIKQTGLTIGCTRDFRNELETGLSNIITIDRHFVSPAEALACLAAETFDIAVVWIPEVCKDGLEVISRIRRKYPDMQVFAALDEKDPDAILNAFRNGAADVLFTEEGRVCPVEVIHRTVTLGCSQAGKGEVFTIFSLKGGAGVTTIAMNLADQIRFLTGEKVLLLDLNLFLGDMTSYLDMAPLFTPYDLIREHERMDQELLFSSLFCHAGGVHILTTPEEINDAESVTGREVVDMISLLQQQFDYVVVDAPHDFSERTLKLMTMTDRLMILAQQNVPSAKSVQKVISFLDEIDFKRAQADIILNRFVKKSAFRAADLTRVLGRPISYLVENNYQLLVRAANKGEMLQKYAPGSTICQQIRKMAAGLTGVDLPAGNRWKKLLFKRMP